MSAEREPNKIDVTVLEYVKAATSSSDRARAVMLVLVTASVLAFTTIWNSGGGWLDQRIEVRHAALSFANTEFKADDPRHTPAEKDLYERASDFLKVTHLDPAKEDDREVIKEQIKQYDRIRSDQFRVIRVPFFGVVFDMNDLGLFAGLSFAVGLLWLRFSLAREYRNLKLTFEESKKRNQVRLCYELMSMHQVLTVPPTQGGRHRKAWINVSKILHVIPALVYSYQVLTDLLTRHIGNILSPRNMWILLVSDFILLGVILVLTAHCLRLYVKIDEEWAGAFTGAYQGAEQPPPGVTGEVMVPVTPRPA